MQKTTANGRVIEGVFLADPTTGNPVAGAAAGGAATVITLLDGATTAPSAGLETAVPRGARAIKASALGTGSVTATVEIYGNDAASSTNAVLLATITLSGTAGATDGFVSDAPWPYLFAKLTTIGGATTAVTVTVSN
jgi:hypothetical protein